MVQKQLVIDIDPDGTIHIDAQGFSGRSCEDATRGIEQALGQVTTVTHKPEFYAQAGQRQAQWGGPTP